MVGSPVDGAPVGSVPLGAVAAEPARSQPIPAELVSARASIDNLDAALVHLLAERFKITRRVGRIKAAAGLPPADPGREAEQIARLRQLAQDSDLDPELAEKFLTFIVREVVRHHERLQADDHRADWLAG
jgi:chorismate mutase